MIDPRCFGLLTLLLAQFDAPAPDPDARDPRTAGGHGVGGEPRPRNAASTPPSSGRSRQPTRPSMPCAPQPAPWR